MKNSDKKVDEDVLAFITESREMLEDMEPQLIRLGERLEDHISADDETVNLIFRVFHTIKGTSAFYQFNNVVAVTHKAETLLEFFRRGKAEISASSTDLLCQACDVTEDLFELIENTGSDEGNEENVRSIIYRLNGRINLFHDKLPASEVPDIPETVFTKDYLKSQAKAIGPKKVGENTRIFISAGRETFEEIERYAVLFSKFENEENKLDGEAVEKMIASVTIIAETAEFLQFDNIMELMQHTIDLLTDVRDNHYVILKHQIQNFTGTCTIVKTVFDHVEEKGVDAGFEPQITSIIKGCFEPERLPPAYTVSEDETVSPAETNDTGMVTPEFKVTPKMKQMFIEESLDLIDRLQDIVIDLKSESSDKESISEAFTLIHRFKGSCGIMLYGDLELLADRAGGVIEAVLDDILALDEWSLRAVWLVLVAMGQTINDIKKGGDGKISNITSLANMMACIQLYAGKIDKSCKIDLPEINKDRIDVSYEYTSIEFPDINTIAAKNKAEGTPRDHSGNTTDTGIISQPAADKAGENKDSDHEHDLYLDTGFIKRMGERRDIRVNLDKLDELINLIGELVIAENMVVKNPDILNLEMENFDRASLHLSKIIRDLQDVALSVRMIPISGVFRKMIRLVHDLASKSNKRISLKLLGEDTEIDKTVAELIADPLVHLVRNAIDHGIEKKEVSQGVGEDGEIVLEARHEGGEVWIIVRDNGLGLDKRKIVSKAAQMGLIDGTGNDLTDQEVYDLIFNPGFSTSNVVTSVSGRGVGMDVVKKNVEKIKGHINVYSKQGEGTMFVMRIPLTLSIIDGMLVRVGEASYTIPLLSIRESLQIHPDQIIITMDGQEMVKVRDDLIPVIRLHEMYHIDTDCIELCKGLIVVVDHQGETAGLFIDKIIGEQQTVIKGLSGYMENIRGVSGCTILGDGEVSLILDVGSLIKRTYRENSNLSDSEMIRTINGS